MNAQVWGGRLEEALGKDIPGILVSASPLGAQGRPEEPRSAGPYTLPTGTGPGRVPRVGVWKGGRGRLTLGLRSWAHEVPALMSRERLPRGRFAWCPRPRGFGAWAR